MINMQQCQCYAMQDHNKFTSTPCFCQCHLVPFMGVWPQVIVPYKQEDKMEKENTGIRDSRSRVEVDMDVITKMVIEMKNVLDSITVQVNGIQDLKEVISSLDLRDKHNNERIEKLEYNKKIMDMLPMSYLEGMREMAEPSVIIGSCPYCGGSGKIKTFKEC
jgi:hypothetical protein